MIVSTPDNQKVYPSYNALSRVAMVWGVPLVAVIVVGMGSMLLALIAAAILGAGGVFFGLVGFPVLLYFKQICETDDQALRITAMEIWCRLTRRNAKSFGNTFTLSPMKFGRRDHVYKRDPE